MGEGFKDLWPDAGLAPAVIAVVYGRPGAEVRRQIAPGRSGARHPEHAGEHGAVVVRGTTRGGLLWREQRGDARPSGIRQGKHGIIRDLDGERARRVGMLARSAHRMAASGDGLVPASKGGPGQASAPPFGWLRERQQQAADLRDGQRDEADSAPFSSALAWSLVISR